MATTQDDYLAEGYFRAGHTVRRTRYVFVEGRFYSTVWSRVPLQAYALRKSQRKLLRRVRRDYAVTVGPYRPRVDQDRLYDRYQSTHPLEVAAEVREVLGYEHPSLPFHTHCLRLEDADGDLVAFSCFDRGSASLASLFGAYEPDRARESLGFATMLLEMAHGAAEGLAYYYPGYCVPGLAPFAYKLRLPALEGRSYVDADWAPMPEVLARPLPKQLVGDALAYLEELLLGHEIACRPLVMPMAENYHALNAPTGPLPHAQMLAIESPVPLGELFVGYDPANAVYEVWIAAPTVDLREEQPEAPWLEEFGPDADLRLYAWRIPVLGVEDPAELLKYFQPGSLLTRLLTG